jgi:hypothetical protein
MGFDALWYVSAHFMLMKQIEEFRDWWIGAGKQKCEQSAGRVGETHLQ